MIYRVCLSAFYMRMKVKMSRVLIKRLIEEINTMTHKEMKIMEVCGTHTQMISKCGGGLER